MLGHKWLVSRLWMYGLNGEQQKSWQNDWRRKFCRKWSENCHFSIFRDLGTDNLCQFQVGTIKHRKRYNKCIDGTLLYPRLSQILNCGSQLMWYSKLWFSVIVVDRFETHQLVVNLLILNLWFKWLFSRFSMKSAAGVINDFLGWTTTKKFVQINHANRKNEFDWLSLRIELNQFELVPFKNHRTL